MSNDLWFSLVKESLISLIRLCFFAYIHTWRKCQILVIGESKIKVDYFLTPVHRPTEFLTLVNNPVFKDKIGSILNLKPRRIAAQSVGGDFWQKLKKKKMKTQIIWDQKPTVINKWDDQARPAQSTAESD